MLFQNKVKQAVDRAGGPTRVANELKCSGTTIFTYIRNGRVSCIDKARKLAELSGMDIQEIRPS